CAQVWATSTSGRERVITSGTMASSEKGTNAIHDKLHVNYVIHRARTLLAEYPDRVIVLDDVSALFNQPIALQLLIAALGQSHDGTKIRQVTHKTAKETKIVKFSGGVICLSNLPLDGHHKAVLTALRDRVVVVNYSPSEEQITALIYRLADDGIRDTSPSNARMVADFLLQECKSQGARLSVRLFVDKALKDFQLHAAGHCETDWRDLVASNVQQQVIALQHPTTDLSRRETVEAERRVVSEIERSYGSLRERVGEWERRTGKSQAAYYRRRKELKQSEQTAASC
ncbi:MAG: hypothetical protein K8U57_00870, partial [Planctomycetes bacterium]|nr:hypothetical protein [Planctomycetota bacterium]